MPRLFSLPQLGNPWEVGLFVLPYTVACIFFAITVSVLVRQREMCILLIVFTSVPLLFISGLSWPGSAIPGVWKAVSYLFPSTFGIRGFVSMNNMGASLADVRHEWNMLCVQSVVYCLTACAAYAVTVRDSRKRIVEAWRRLSGR